MKKIQSYNPNVISSYNWKQKNNSSSKILASTQVQFQEIIEKFIHKRKSKQKETADKDNIPLKCFTLSEEPNKNRFTEIVKLLCLKYLNAQEEKRVINLIFNSQARFHIPEERLIATNILQHQILTTDDRPINIQQYRFPQLHKEEINKQVENLLEGSVVKPSQSLCNMPIYIVQKKRTRKETRDEGWY